jgi:hypothetical protein
MPKGKRDAEDVVDPIVIKDETTTDDLEDMPPRKVNTNSFIDVLN